MDRNLQKSMKKLQGVLALCEFHYCEFHYCNFSKHSRNICLMLFWAKIFHYCNFGIITKYRKNRSNEIFWPKNALAKYFWSVLKNRSNEIRIGRGSPVITLKKC